MLFWQKWIPDKEEERIRKEQRDEQDKLNRELEREMRKMLKSVKLVSTSNYTNSMCISDEEQFDFIHRLSNIWSFISECERENHRSKFLNIFLISTFFA